VYPSLDPESGEICTADAHHLYLYLREHGLILPVEDYDEELLRIDSEAIVARIQAGRGDWESEFLEEVCRLIKERRLFGFRGGQ